MRLTVLNRNSCPALFDSRGEPRKIGRGQFGGAIAPEVVRSSDPKGPGRPEKTSAQFGRCIFFVFIAHWKVGFWIANRPQLQQQQQTMSLCRLKGLGAAGVQGVNADLRAGGGPHVQGVTADLRAWEGGGQASME